MNLLMVVRKVKYVFPLTFQCEEFYFHHRESYLCSGPEKSDKIIGAIHCRPAEGSMKLHIVQTEQLERQLYSQMYVSP